MRHSKKANPKGARAFTRVAVTAVEPERPGLKSSFAAVFFLSTAKSLGPAGVYAGERAAYRCLDVFL